VVFGVALEPCDEVRAAAFLEPCEAGVVVDLGDGARAVLGHVVGRELDGAPRVDEPPVGVVEGFDAPACEGWAGEEDGGGPCEGFDVPGGVAEGPPDVGCGAALPAEVRERGRERAGGHIVPRAPKLGITGAPSGSPHKCNARGWMLTWASGGANTW
jgi:hypothetical protein